VRSSRSLVCFVSLRRVAGATTTVVVRWIYCGARITASRKPTRRVCLNAPVQAAVTPVYVPGQPVQVDFDSEAVADRRERLRLPSGRFHHGARSSRRERSLRRLLVSSLWRERTLGNFPCYGSCRTVFPSTAVKQRVPRVPRLVGLPQVWSRLEPRLPAPNPTLGRAKSEVNTVTADTLSRFRG